MSVIIIAGIIWGICKLISAASAASKERARQAEMARVRAEQAEQRQQRNEEIRQRIEQQRELLRLAKAEREQAEWNRKQEEINRRQEEHNRRTDERLLKIEQKLELAKREEAKWKAAVERYDNAIEASEAWINSSAVKEALEVKTATTKGWVAQQQIIQGIKTEREKIEKAKEDRYNAETKLIKARQQRELAERQMEAA